MMTSCISQIVTINFLEHVTDEFTTAEQAAVATSITAAAAAVAPPPINMFPPQGAPQPGAVSAGGGITPAVALTVKHTNYRLNQSLVNENTFISYIRLILFLNPFSQQ